MGEKQPPFGIASGYTPGIFVSTLTVAFATVYLTWPWLVRERIGPTNSSLITFPSEEDIEA